MKSGKVNFGKRKVLIFTVLFAALAFAIVSIGCASAGFGTAGSSVPTTGLLFSDDFSRGTLGGEWTSGATSDKANTIKIVDGRVQATADFNYIELQRPFSGNFSGNFRIEVDIEKVGTSPNPCWDFYVELVALKTGGVILFDTKGFDGINIGKVGMGGACGHKKYSMDSAGPNKGKVILEYKEPYMQFNFTNIDGNSLNNGKIWGTFGSTKIRIWLAGFPESPRYIDNVKVYSLEAPTPPPTKKPDLEPYEIIWKPPSPTTSDNITITWKVRNGGDADAVGKFYTKLYIDGKKKKSWSTDGLAARKSTSGSMNIGKLSAGDHTIKVETDATGAISESNESNNEYSRTLTVTEVMKPDLKPYKITLVPSKPSTSDSISIAWSIKNQGNRDAVHRFCVELYVDGEIKKSWHMAGLTVGKDTSDSMNIGKLSAGDHTITVVADTTDTIDEINESNNIYIQNLTVIKKPDLTPYAITWRPSRPCTSDNITITWKVKNIGDGDAEGTFNTTLYVDDVKKGTWYNDSLAAEDYLFFSIDIGTLSPGNYTVTVETDTTNIINENNEANNIRSKNMTVTLPRELLGYWNFNEESGNIAFDRSGNENNGAIHNATRVDNEDCGKALSFNGRNGYVEILDDVDLTAYTVEAWVKPTDVTESQNIILRTDKYGPLVRAGSELKPGNWSPQLWLRGYDRKLKHYLWDTSTPQGIGKEVSCNTRLDAGTWYHVAGVVTIYGVMKLYVNGNEEGTPVHVGTHWTGGDRYLIGHASWERVNFFNGTIDEVRIYNYALNQSEILEDMRNCTLSTLKPPSTLSLGEAVDNTGLTWTTGGDADWFRQTSTNYSGGDAAQSGAITRNQDSWIQTTVSGPGTLSFSWRVESEQGYDCLGFYIDDDLQDVISGDRNWHQMNYSIASGSHKLKWMYAKDNAISSSQDCGWLDKVEFSVTMEPPPVSLGEAVDNTGLTWITGGNADWFGQTSTYFYGEDAAQSGAITNNQDSWIRTTVSGPGTLSFYWKVSSETDHDYLKFYIDNTMKYRISGDRDWKQIKSYSISHGTHTLTWKYTKDGAVDTGFDCGWLDKVVFSAG